MDYYVGVLKKYAVFEGRATRSEYWYFVLFNLLISIAIGIVEGALFKGSALLGNLYSLALLVPSLAVGARRLHDIGKSGWWMLIALIPIVGWIMLIVWYATDTQLASNEYGPNPKEATVATPSDTNVPPVAPVV